MIIFTIVSGLLMAGCGEGYKYKRLVKNELAKGTRYDTLFLGIYLGMKDKDFYSHCWQLNKNGIIRQGSGNTTVYYKMTDLKEPVEVNFYPSFYHGKIWQVPVKFNYESWAPWNKALVSDTLEMDILGKFKEWYGDGFHQVLNKRKEVAFYKVDGNRLISIYKEGDMDVWAIFTDLLVDQEIRKMNKEPADSIPSHQKGQLP